MAVWLLLLLVLFQGGCLAESTLDRADLQCGPRDLTVECCLKKNPGQWEKCTGTPNPGESGVSKGVKRNVGRAVAAGTAVAVALQPRINSAEQRGVELATDLLGELEEAILKCVRRAERAVNDHYFNGESPSRERCAERKREGQTWAMYLRLRKHDEAQECLAVELWKLLPGRYLFQPRFRFNEQTGKWEFLSQEEVDRVLSRQRHRGLEGTIAPDIVIMDVNGLIIRVYDMKFPCPGTNDARWETYKTGRWVGRTQGQVYGDALQTEPRLVSPKRISRLRED
jgi:hypothetical protein